MSSSTPRIAIAAIFKNEGPYILEWIAYHRALGIDRFFIADNDSKDGSTELLAALHDAGVVVHIPFPTHLWTAPQLPAYREIMARHRDDADWTAFIDADEFLLPTDGAKSIRPLICEIAEDPNVGSIGVNWAIYGSSGQIDAAPELVIERFSKRAEQACGANAHYKTIVRNCAWGGTSPTPHTFLLESGYHQVSTNGSPIEQHPRLGDGLSASIIWERLRLNHYVVKSKNEFLFRKRKRGRATRSGIKRAVSFFESHDRNEVVDAPFDWLVAATKAELARLIELIGDGDKAQAALRRVSNIDLAPKPIDPEKLLPIKGAIDKIEVDADRQIISVCGWALTAQGERAGYLAPMIGLYIPDNASLRRVERPDVVRHVPTSVLDSGYELKFSLGDVPAEFLDVDKLRVVGGGSHDSIEFQIGTTGKVWPRADVQRALAQESNTSVSPAPAIKDSPEMPEASVEYLARFMQQSKCYLEYGTGGSTVMAARIGIPAIVAVESDFAWRNAVQRKIDMLDVSSNAGIFILHADIGATKELGYPASDKFWDKYHNYALEAWRLCRNEKLSPDLVLIDGRFRVACCLASFLFAASGTRILFDDYIGRPHYFSVENFVQRARTIDRVAEFIVPAELPRDEVWLALMTAVTDPR